MPKLCIIKECKKVAVYGITNNIHCNEHRLINEINKLGKKCKTENCDKLPIYGFEKGISLYCKTHKTDNMIDVKSKKCIELNCNKVSNYNLPKEKTGIYCAEHKKENMIDIKNKKCKENNCNIQPTYNYINKPAKYCKKHKSNGMVDVNSKRCLEENCNTRPHYNYPNEKKALYCVKHKLKNMENIISKMCIQCKITYSNPNTKYKGYCVRCFIFQFPNEKISKNYKVKEVHMTDFLKYEFKEVVMIFDKQTGGCSKRRPDVYIDKFTHVLIIECDENQHKKDEYTSCENKRIMELFQDFGNRPIVVIRFNPDSYIKEDKIIRSSFKLCTNTGILRLS